MITRIGISGLWIAFGLLLAPVGAFAAQTTVVLNVHHAYCALCPSIVKKTLEQVNGVTNVTVGDANANGDMLATVRYDDAQSAPAALIKATTDHGYPADIAKRPNG